ncbi:hypothetical protein PN462_20140 [Spirulina sp. CS-785/01]|nr:hypothetical protein [Spirulina sp. CS-785/01]MDB9315436.1 hypothetical protein [Spirulina sp. CS-785/01]
MNNYQDELLVETTVTYAIEFKGKVFVIENVPARVNPDTGENFFAPDTVERIQQIIFNAEEPKYFIETPVYDFV